MCMKSKGQCITLSTENFKAILWKTFFDCWLFFFVKSCWSYLLQEKKNKLSSVYIYELDLGLDRASKGVILSLELDLEVEGLIHSTLLRSRFRSTSSVVLILLDVGCRSKSNSVTFQRPRTRFRPHYCFHY